MTIHVRDESVGIALFRGIEDDTCLVIPTDQNNTGVLTSISKSLVAGWKKKQCLNTLHK